MAERCTYQNAEKVIYSIKGNAQLNSEIAVLLKDGFKRGKIKIPINENEGKEYLKRFKGYEGLSPEVKGKFLSSYAQITLLINEMINLEAEYSDNGQVKLKEPKSKRKDRYSSVAYGNYIATVLERQLNKQTEYDVEDELVYF